MNITAIPDFYVLWLAKQQPRGTAKTEKVGEKLDQMFNHLVPNLAQAMRDYLFMACLGEARHARNTSSQVEYYIPGCEGGEREEAIDEASREYAPNPDSWSQLHDLFNMAGWASSLGGRKWGEIALVGSKYSQTVEWVDTAINAVHNGTFVLNKAEALRKVFNIPEGLEDNDDLSIAIVKYLTWRSLGNTNVLSQFAYFVPSSSVSQIVTGLTNCFLTDVGEGAAFSMMKDHNYKEYNFGEKTIELEVNEYYNDSPDEDDDDEDYHDDDDDYVEVRLYDEWAQYIIMEEE